MTTSSPLFSLEGQHILLTGASSGIGAETLRLLIQLGAAVTISGRDSKKLEAVQSAARVHLPQAQIELITADLAAPENSAHLIQELKHPVHSFIHCAGMVELAPLKFLQSKKIEAMFQVNYHAAVQLTQALIKQNKMRDGGSIVYISSIAGLDAAIRGNAIYSGTKAALMATARVFALELASKKIRVNCVAPGMIRTPLASQVAAQHDAEAAALDEKKYPLGYGEPKDVAAAVAYLISDAARWVTGTSLVVDGGYTAQ